MGRGTHGADVDFGNGESWRAKGDGDGDLHGELAVLNLSRRWGFRLLRSSLRDCHLSTDRVFASQQHIALVPYRNYIPSEVHALLIQTDSAATVLN